MVARRKAHGGGVAAAIARHPRNASAAAQKPSAARALQPAGRAPHWRVAAALELIKRDYQSPRLDLETASARVGITKFHLCRIFRSEVGVGFSAYLKAFRAERAMELLRGTTLSVKEIAAAVGFDYVTQLDRAFAARFGVTPTVARQRAGPGTEGSQRASI